MLITRTAFTTAGLAVEFARDMFRPDRIKISLRTGIGTNRPEPAPGGGLP